MGKLKVVPNFPLTTTSRMRLIENLRPFRNVSNLLNNGVFHCLWYLVLKVRIVGVEKPSSSWLA